MTQQVQNPLTSSRFINMCVSNWFLHLYVYSMIPLLYAQAREFSANPLLVGWCVVAFAIGMILPGPFGAHLMERRSRKQVFLKSLLLTGLLSTIGYSVATAPWMLIVLHGMQGVGFGIAQTALGTTLVNDVLYSRYRNRGDAYYAWAGRLGIPLGLLLGYTWMSFLPITDAWWWALVPCALSFLLVAQTQVPVKAPVKVALMTCDRFFLPKSCPLSLTMFAAPWMMGRVVGNFPGGWVCLSMAVGALLAFIIQLMGKHRLSQRIAVALGYLCVVVAWLLIAYPVPATNYLAYILIGGGVGAVSSRHLLAWLITADHCQRGTAQSTYMLSWRLAFAFGFLSSAYFAMEHVAFDLLLSVVSLLLYLLWVSKREPSAETLSL